MNAISKKATVAAVGFALGTLGLVSSALAAPTVYFGETLGAGENTRLAVFANATNARNSFLSGLTGVGTESFEGYAAGTSTPLAISFPGAGTATLSGTGQVVSTSPGTTNGFGRYATDGNQFWEATSSFSITFSAPVAAFGFMGVDIGDFNGQVTVTTAGGLNQVFNVGNTIGGAGGGVLFWGVIDNATTFTSVSFGNTNSGTDFFGFDQMTIGSLQQVTPVPEPETYAMLLAGLGLLGFVARRRKQKLAIA
jgi:hypothetical protein